MTPPPLPEPELVMFVIKDADSKPIREGVARLIRLEDGRMRLEPLLPEDPTIEISVPPNRNPMGCT